MRGAGILSGKKKAINRYGGNKKILKHFKMNIKKYISGLFILWLLVSCQQEKVQNTRVCVLIDVTDEKFRDDKFISENLPKFLTLMKLDKESGGFSGGAIKLSLINEVSDSKSKTVKIDVGETGLLGENPLTRKDEVERFYSGLEQSFSALLDEADWGTDASKIYQKVTRELIKMKKGEADRKYLIVYSDMLENSDLFSFYGPGWKNRIGKMMEDPGKTLEELAKTGPALPDLSEFEILVIVSRNPANDEQINISEQFWTTLFEYRGAEVSFNSILEI